VYLTYTIYKFDKEYMYVYFGVIIFEKLFLVTAFYHHIDGNTFELCSWTVIYIIITIICMCWWLYDGIEVYDCLGNNSAIICEREKYKLKSETANVRAIKYNKHNCFLLLFILISLYNVNTSTNSFT